MKATASNPEATRIIGISLTLMRRSAIAAACAAAMPWSAAHAQGVDKVTFGWPAANAIALAHVQFGKDLGFFKAERVDVEVVPM